MSWDEFTLFIHFSWAEVLRFVQGTSVCNCCQRPFGCEFASCVAPGPIVTAAVATQGAFEQSEREGQSVQVDIQAEPTRSSIEKQPMSLNSHSVKQLQYKALKSCHHLHKTFCSCSAVSTFLSLGDALHVHLPNDCNSNLTSSMTMRISSSKLEFGPRLPYLCSMYMLSVIDVSFSRCTYFVATTRGTELHR